MREQVELDVFGRRMLATLGIAGWNLSLPGDDGKRRPLDDIVIPSDARTEEQLIAYLADLYHESATPRHPHVRRVG